MPDAASPTGKSEPQYAAIVGSEAPAPQADVADVSGKSTSRCFTMRSSTRGYERITARLGGRVSSSALRAAASALYQKGLRLQEARRGMQSVGGLGGANRGAGERPEPILCKPSQSFWEASAQSLHPPSYRTGCLAHRAPSPHSGK
jgi:hypothetical protein